MKNLAVALALVMATPLAGFCFGLEPTDVKEAAMAAEGLDDSVSEAKAKAENKAKKKNKSAEEVAKAGKIAAAKQTLSVAAQLMQRFDMGVAIGYENYKSDYINEATAVGANRKVVVTNVQSRNASMWLETHYTLDGFAAKHGFTKSAPGFYVGVKLIGEDDQSFDAFSAGLLWSFKRKLQGAKKEAGKSKLKFNNALNVGIGAVWHRTQRLANGIIEGADLPTEFDSVLLRKDDEITWMVMISAGL